MILDPSRRTSGKPPSLSSYPLVTLADGRRVRVDRAGLLVGRINGHDRIEHRHEPPVPEDVRAASDWIDRLVRTKTPNISSYKLKHACEKWRGIYVPNGAMIYALHLARFPLHCGHFHESPLNVRVGVHLRHYHRLPETSPTFTSDRRRGER
jgi:hypothetical protein